MTEARVENDLHSSRHRWFFSIRRFFKRIWNYEKNPSGFVKFCDDESIYNNPENSPSQIRTSAIVEPVISLQQQSGQLKKHLESYLKQEQFNNRAKHSSVSVTSTKQGLFKEEHAAVLNDSQKLGWYDVTA